MKKFASYLLGLSVAISALGHSVHAAEAKGKHFDTIIVVMFENTDYKTALEQPFFKKFAHAGTLLENYQGVIHPSQGNYIALTSGDINGAPDDELYNIKARHIGDLLNERGLTWKAYAEAYPGGCFKGMRRGTYWRKHNPMISYTNISGDAKRCANIVNADQFEKDIAKNLLPNYSFFVPDINNDGHDTGPAFAAKWFEKRFSAVLTNKKLMARTLVVATFDENAGEPDMRIYTAIVGGPVKTDFTSATELNHYSLLRMVEDNFFLGTLGKHDATAKPFPEIWK